MIDYNEIFSLNSFSMLRKHKEKWYFSKQKKLSKYHSKYCNEYNQISKKLFCKIDDAKDLSLLPFIHVDIFKKKNLISNIGKKTKIFQSSGTMSNHRSKINIDFKTSILQSKALRKIFNNFFKDMSQTIFFLDKKSTLTKKTNLIAKDIATQGFNQIFEKSFFLLHENGSLNLKILKKFLNFDKKQKFVIFGFTSLIWEKIYLELKKKKIRLIKNNGILIHGGGWKKMENLNIKKKIFDKKIKDILGIKKIHNYYGMVEQPGSIFFECEYNYFHTSIFSEIIFRDRDLKVSKLNQKGQIQLFSILPLSYPGHNILTEDTGILRGIDNCKCGRKGKYFSLLERVPDVELRGCSDA